MGNETSAGTQAGDGRSQRQGSKTGRGRWSDLELEEGKPQRERGVLASSRGPVSPGPPKTEMEEPGGALGP